MKTKLTSTLTLLTIVLLGTLQAHGEIVCRGQFGRSAHAPLNFTAVDIIKTITALDDDSMYNQVEFQKIEENSFSYGLVTTKDGPDYVDPLAFEFIGKPQFEVSLLNKTLGLRIGRSGESFQVRTDKKDYVLVALFGVQTQICEKAISECSGMPDPNGKIIFYNHARITCKQI